MTQNKTGFVCMLYMPSFYRSYGRESLKKITEILSAIKKVGFWGIYLIALFRDGGKEQGFDIVDYDINQKFGSEEDFDRLIARAHELGIAVGVDLVPHHVSDRHVLVRRALKGLPGFKDAIYIVSEAEAARLTAAGVPNFFGENPYSKIDGKFVRTAFLDYHQVDVNWENWAVRRYFRSVIRKLKARGIDFLRVDCGSLLLEDVSRADPNNPSAVFQPARSVEAVRDVAEEMPLFFEWFDTSDVSMFDKDDESWALACDYVAKGQIDMTNWDRPKVVPLVGGHDQMTLADRGLAVEKVLERMRRSRYAFLDLATLVWWRTDPDVIPGDAEYDADLSNPNQRYRGRRPIGPIVEKFMKGETLTL